MFARVLGPYLVIITCAALARASHLRTLLRDFGSSSVWPWVTGAFVLLGGLTVVALHQYWRGTAAVIVSLIGWLTTLKGVALVAFPRPYISAGESAVDGTWWWIVMVIVALAGLYLTYVGWIPERGVQPPKTAGSAPDLPRAA
jgi:hypothetical protein